MLRPTRLAILLCLTLGVVINVGVALGCLWRDLTSRETLPLAQRYFGQPALTWQSDTPAGWPSKPDTVEVQHGWGITVRSCAGTKGSLPTTNEYVPDGEPPPRYAKFGSRQLSTGWPMRSLTSIEFWGDPTLPLIPQSTSMRVTPGFSTALGTTAASPPPIASGLCGRWQCGLVPPSAVARKWNTGTAWTPHIPIYPFAGGFVVNTLCYAIVSYALLFSLPIAVRAYHRRRHGRCARCNYDRSSLDAAAHCPECGHVDSMR